MLFVFRLLAAQAASPRWRSGHGLCVPSAARARTRGFRYGHRGPSTGFRFSSACCDVLLTLLWACGPRRIRRRRALHHLSGNTACGVGTRVVCSRGLENLCVVTFATAPPIPIFRAPRGGAFFPFSLSLSLLAPSACTIKTMLYVVGRAVECDRRRAGRDQRSS